MILKKIILNLVSYLALLGPAFGLIVIYFIKFPSYKFC